MLVSQSEFQKDVKELQPQANSSLRIVLFTNMFLLANRCQLLCKMS